MKVCCLGAEHYINQVSRIREGFLENGCVLVQEPSEADIIYCNDPSTIDDVIRAKPLKAKIIFNILDIPPHLLPEGVDISRYTYINHPYRRDFSLATLKEKLKHADIVTCICEDVKTQLQDWLNIDSHVIYNPIKDVSFLNLKEGEKKVFGKKYKFAFIGRANDVNKRFYLVRDTILALNEDPDSLCVVGTEYPGFGAYQGVVIDSLLNRLLNSVDFIFLPSAFKSIGLPALEAVVTKTIPIVCDDDPTSAEFFNGIAVPPDGKRIAGLITDEAWLRNAKNFVESHSDVYKQKFSKKQIAKNILDLVS